MSNEIKKQLIEKGFMPADVDFCCLHERCFKYQINGKWIVKLFDGTILVDDIYFCIIYDTYLTHKIDGKEYTIEFEDFIKKEKSDPEDKELKERIQELEMAKENLENDVKDLEMDKKDLKQELDEYKNKEKALNNWFSSYKEIMDKVYYHES